MNVDTMLTSYLHNAEVAGRKSLKSMRTRAKQLRLHFGGAEASVIDIRRLQAYRESRTNYDKVSPVTVNRELEVLRAAFRLYDLPWPKVARARENNVRQGFFTDEDFWRLMDYLPEHLSLFSQWAFYTGWRKSEIANLQWESIIKDSTGAVHEIRLGDSKNGHGRVIPISGPLRKIIDRIWFLDTADDHAIKSPWVFHDSDGNKIRDFRRSWATACKQAGVIGRLFHDLRRTAVRNMILKGVDRQVAKAITGHKTDSMFTRYQIVDTKQMTSALEKL